MFANCSGGCLVEAYLVPRVRRRIKREREREREIQIQKRVDKKRWPQRGCKSCALNAALVGTITSLQRFSAAPTGRHLPRRFC